MTPEKQVKLLVHKAQKDRKVFETRKVEFKETYVLRHPNGKINKAVQAELIRDVMSLANALPDPELEMGFLILGISRSGDIPVDFSLDIADISELPHLINGVMEREITISYRTYSIDGKQVGAIIVPRSSGIPHIVKNQLSENEKTYLRPGECWTRTEGGKKIAMASDFDEMYEYSRGINKFESVKSKRKLVKEVKRKKTKAQTDAISQVFNFDNEGLNDRIKKLLSR